MVVDNSVLTLENFGSSREPLEDTSLGSGLARCKRAIGKPPQEDNAQNDTNKTINHKHPAETHNTSLSIHKLKSRRHETNNSGRNLRSSEVIADSLSSTRRRVEQSEIKSHARPHASNDESKQ